MSRRGPLIVAGLTLVVLLLAFFFVVKPKMDEVSDARAELAQAQDDEDSLRMELARLQTLEQEAPEVRQELATLRKKLPPVADLPGLINLLQTAADRSGVDFFSVSPGDPAAVTGASASEIPAQIQVVGGFFQVDEFLFRLETLRRAAKVQVINLAGGTEGLPQLSVQLDVRFYTTDVEAGPGAGIEGAAPQPVPAASPSPGATPTPAATTTPGA